MEQTGNTETGYWTPGRVVAATLVVLLVGVLFWLFFNLRLVFFSLFTAIVLSTAIEPLIERMARRGIPRSTSVVIISLIILLALAVLVIQVTPLITDQWATITGIVTNGYEDIREALVRSESLLVRRLGRQLPPYLPLTLPPPDLEDVQGDSLNVAEQAFNTATAFVRSLLTVLAVLLLTSFWAIEGDRAIRFLLLGAPANRRDSIREFIDELKSKVGAYTRGIVILSLIIGLLQMIAYFIIGLPNALLLGVLAGIAEIIPLIGPTLGAIPAIIVAAAFDPTKIIWVIVATVLIQLVENNIVAPRVMDRQVGVNPVASLLAFVAFGTIFGFVGALLAIPLAALIQLVLNRLVFKANPSDTLQPQGRDTISILRYEAQNLMQDVRKQVRTKESELTKSTDEVEDAMEAIIADLDSILAKIETEGNGQPSEEMQA